MGKCAHSAIQPRIRFTAAPICFFDPVKSEYVFFRKFCIVTHSFGTPESSISSRAISGVSEKFENSNFSDTSEMACELIELSGVPKE